jgi:hypothetical protein
MTAYETKDSGHHLEYDSGMRRDSQDGKPRFDLIRTKLQPYEEQMIYRYAMLLARGAEKYSARNWEEGDSEEELERAKASLLRHTEQLVAGETDEDHAAAVWFNSQAIEYFRWRIAQKAERPLELTLSWDGSKDPGNFALLMETVSGFLYTPKATMAEPEKDVDPVEKLGEIWKDAGWISPAPAAFTREERDNEDDFTVAKARYQAMISDWHNRPRTDEPIRLSSPSETKRRPDEWLKRYNIELLAGDLGDTYAEITQGEFFFRLNQGGNAWKQQTGVLDESAGLD